MSALLAHTDTVRNNAIRHPGNLWLGLFSSPKPRRPRADPHSRSRITPEQLGYHLCHFGERPPLVQEDISPAP
jgi:hypothetical protein